MPILTITAEEFINELIQPSMIDDQLSFQIHSDNITDLILMRKALASLDVNILSEERDSENEFTYFYTDMTETQYEEIRDSIR